MRKCDLCGLKATLEIQKERKYRFCSKACLREYSALQLQGINQPRFFSKDQIQGMTDEEQEQLYKERRLTKEEYSGLRWWMKKGYESYHSNFLGFPKFVK